MMQGVLGLMQATPTLLPDKQQNLLLCAALLMKITSLGAHFRERCPSCHPCKVSKPTGQRLFLEANVHHAK